MKVLLLSAYDAMSHQYWRHHLAADLKNAFKAEVVTVELPNRHFSWRFRGNSLTFAHDSRLQQTFDLVIATSMTDLSALRGMLPSIADIPTVLYFHENQFAYPDAHQERQVERQITSIYSAICADRLVFNSNFNRTSFLGGAKALLKKMPDGVPSGVVESLADKSTIIHVPVQAVSSGDLEKRTATDVLTLIWNHRWEHDKGLDDLLQLVIELKDVPYQLHLVGESFRKIPKEVEEIRAQLGDKLGQFGFVKNRQAYFDLLLGSDLVVSTARQEFQGLAVLEAVAAGCTPVVPDSLAYQDFIDPECRYQTITEAAVMVRAAGKSQERNRFANPDAVQPLQVKNAWIELVNDLKP